jgi:hypothetical protein
MRVAPQPQAPGHREASVGSEPLHGSSAYVAVRSLATTTGTRLQEHARSDDCDCSAQIANEPLCVIAATGDDSSIGICRRVARSGSTLTVASHRAACSRLYG